MDTDEHGEWQQPDLGRPAAPRTGRGAVSNPVGRFEPTRAEFQDDGWGSLDEPLPPLATTVLPERARSIISRNDSPDVPFEQSINAYRGCEHGCVYCFARPTHSYVGLSPGLDFETKLFYKVDAAALLRRELARPGYRCTPIALGSNTDPYQPLERKLRVTRSLLEVFDECSHPFSIVTKSALVTRDLDLLAPLATRRLVRVYVSITTLCDDLKRRMEPRAASPGARLAAVRALSGAGVPVGVMVAPVVPGLTDHELEAILERAAEAGAQSAAFLLMRLPHEVKDLFYEWAGAHYPQKVSRIRSILRDLRGGRDNDPRFGKRMTGEGPFADLLRQRYHAACRRLGLDDQRAAPLDTTAFRPPRADSPQLPLF